MPLMAGIKAVCLQVDGWRPWGLLMGSGGEEEDRKSIQDLAKTETSSPSPSAPIIDLEKTVVLEELPKSIPPSE
jgi:hypothetical protein